MNADQQARSCRSVQIAIERAGSAEALSQMVGCGLRSIYYWRDGGRTPSAQKAKELAEAVDMQPEDFRPDVFG